MATRLDELPQHQYESAHYNEDKDHPDAICLARLKTASFERDGFEMFVQCGHTLAEHQEQGETWLPTS